MTKVAIILTQGFADWEYALLAGTGGPFYGLDIQFFTPEVGQVRSQGGLIATVSQGLDSLSSWSPKAIAVIGGTVWATSEAPDIRELLKTQHSKGTIIAGICGGTLALARADLLNTSLHTSNDADFLTRNATSYSGFECFRHSAAAIADNRVITAPGTAPVSFTAAIFEGIGVAKETVHQFSNMLAAEHA